MKTRNMGREQQRLNRRRARNERELNAKLDQKKVDAESAEDKQLKQTYAKLEHKAGEMEHALTNVKKELFSDEALASFARRLKSDFSWLSIVTAIISIPFNLYRVIYALAVSEEHHFRRGTRVLLGSAGIALSFLSALVAASIIYVGLPILLVVSSVKGAVDGLWETGLSLYDRFIGKGKHYQEEINRLKEKIKSGQNTPDKFERLTHLLNEQRELNKEIAHSVHSCAQSFGAVLGSAMLFFPPTAPVGAIILACVAGYGIADAFGVNPLKWAWRGANKISELIRGKPLFKPFAPKTVHDVKAELRAELRQERRQRRHPQPYFDSNFYQVLLPTEKRTPAFQAAGTNMGILRRLNPDKPMRKVMSPKPVIEDVDAPLKKSAVPHARARRLIQPANDLVRKVPDFGRHK